MPGETALKTYSCNFGFANIHEFRQFCWFKEVLDKNEYKFCHNFYIYDPRGDTYRFREIDFGIISNKIFLLMEHKCGLSKAEDFVDDYNRIHHSVMRFLNHQGIYKEKYPRIWGEVITKDDSCDYTKGQKPHVINSPEDTESFYNNTIKSIKWRPIQRSSIESILETLNCKPYEYKRIDDSIFNKFYKIREFAKKVEENHVTINDEYNFINEVYNNFSSINYLLSDIFLSFEKERLGKKEEYNPIFHLHTMSPNDIINNIYPIYWACSTCSQEKETNEHFQLGFHISDQDWYSGKHEGPRRKHFTIKLAFFRDIKKIKILRKFQNKLINERSRFEKLLLELNENDDKHKYVFFRTIKDKWDVEERPIAESTIGEIIDLIIRYNDGTPENAIPRSTEFIKVYDWDKDMVMIANQKKNIKAVFKRERHARKFLRTEYEKLVELYKFMIDVVD